MREIRIDEAVYFIADWELALNIERCLMLRCEWNFIARNIAG